jgi:hypothetical protein
MTYLSPAPALADGYFKNFISPVVSTLTTHKGDKYFYDVGVAPAGEHVPNKLDETTILGSQDRERLDLQVIVPARIGFAKRAYVNELRGKLQPALIETTGRTFEAWAYRTLDGLLHLVDIPTTLQGVESAVDRRMRYPGFDRDSSQWRDVEQQEISRFTLMLQTNIKTQLGSAAEQQRVRVIRSDQIVRDESFKWLDEIWPRTPSQP